MVIHPSALSIVTAVSSLTGPCDHPSSREVMLPSVVLHVSAVLVLVGLELVNQFNSTDLQIFYFCNEFTLRK